VQPLAVRLGSGAVPLPSIDVADALLDERYELTEWLDPLMSVGARDAIEG
jgi:hypothetical protein